MSGGGYGRGPFGFYYGIPYPNTLVENPADLSSSRKVDGVTKRYVPDEAGGFEPMDDTDQRVLMIISFALIDEKFITPQALRSEELGIRNALSAAGLTDPRRPVIKLQRVTSERVASGEVRRTVVYQNLLSNTQKTIRA